MQIFYGIFCKKCDFICVYKFFVLLLQPQKPERVPYVMYNRDSV